MKAAFNAPRRVAGLVLYCLLSSSHAQTEASTASATPASFTIEEVLVEGNTVLPVRLVEQVVTPFTGPGKHADDVERARAALEKVYQDAGYLSVVVDAPDVDLSLGELRLVVTEGKVARLQVSGAQYTAPSYIRQNVPELAEGQVPNFNKVQQQLMGVNKGDDRRVQPIIRPGRTPGTVETELKVSDALPLSFNVELNNRQSPDTRPLRLNATVRYDNLFQRDHSVAATFITAPQDTSQSKVATVGYTMPAGDGATWALYALRSDSLIEPVGASTVVGKGTVAGLRYVQPLPSLPDYSHSLTMGVDYKHFRERIGSEQDSPSTPLLYLPFSLAYNANALGERSQTRFSGTLTAAARNVLQRTVDCPGYTTPQDQFACKNPYADGSFVSLRLDWRRTQALWARWNALVKLGGQVSSQPLVSNEQFALGGADTVRGYLEAEAAGDQAAMGTLELQSPNWLAGAPATGWLQELSNQFFVDVGRVYVNDPLPGVPVHTSLLSVGMGLKLRTAKVMNADMSVAWPLRRASHYTELHQPRLHARMAWQF